MAGEVADRGHFECLGGQRVQPLQVELVPDPEIGQVLDLPERGFRPETAIPFTAGIVLPIAGLSGGRGGRWGCRRGTRDAVRFPRCHGPA